MVRHLVRNRSALAFSLSLALIPALACSRAASRPATEVAPVHATADTQKQLIPLAELSDGSRIRYNRSDRWYGRRVARVRRVEGDTLWLDLGWFRPDAAIPVATLRRLELSTNHKERERVAAWATGIGIATGVILGLTVDPPECGEGCDHTEYPGDRAAAAVLLGMYGAVAGMVAGWIVVPGEQWAKVEVPAVSR